MLVYGVAAYCVDEYLKIGTDTALKCMKFCLAIIQVFGEEYLRKPNQGDVDRLLQVAEAHDFCGMLGCIDYMHWGGRIVQQDGRVQGLYKVPTIILEVVASYDTWI